MDTFKAQSAEVAVDGDLLTLTTKKIGADDVRRIPLAAVTDVRVKPGGRFAPAFLQLVLNNEPPAEMSPNEQNTLLFPSTAKYKPGFDALLALLQDAAERNRAAGGGPVAYDAPKKGRLTPGGGPVADDGKKSWLDRTAEKLDATAERQRQRRGDDLANQLTAAGITRTDLVAAGHATANMFGMAAELPKLAQTVRRDEQVLRATRGAIAGDSKLIAVTGTRLIIVNSATFSSAVDEFPLTVIVATSTETEWLTNGFTIRLQSGHTLELDNVDDLTGFVTALRDAVHLATLPAPQPVQAPPPAPAPAPAQPDVLGQITKLGELHAAGVLTDEEFQAKKTQLLDRL